MIVSCEQCQARFHLDESRIPPGGTRVRCSRCKHAFLLAAPGRGGPDLLDELIQQTAAEPLGAPPPTEDLPEPVAPASAKRAQRAEREPTASEARSEAKPSGGGGSGSARAGTPGRGGSGLRPEPAPQIAHPAETDGEESWEFSERVPGPGEAAEPTPPPSALERLELDPAGRVTPPGELSDPGTWSFSEEEGGIPELSPAPAPEVRVRPGPAQASTRPARPDPERTAARPRRTEAQGPRPVVRLARAAGWAATAWLGLLVLGRALAPSAEPEATSSGSLPAGPLAAESLRGRFVENALEGPLLVVTGELVNPGAEPTAAGALLEVRLLGDDGGPLPSAAALGLDPGERTLRETASEQLESLLAASGEALARAPLAPGARVPVAAVFPSVPPEAARFSLEARELPEPQPEPAAPEAGNGGDVEGSGTAG